MLRALLLAASVVALPLHAQGGDGPLCVVTNGEVAASDADFGDYFADALDTDGAFAVIGAEGQDTFGPFSGGAYVFEHVGGAWLERQALSTANALDPGDRFGAAVAIGGDRIVVGADGDDDAAQDAGAVYVYERQGASWVQTDKLVAGDATSAALFGKSVAIDGDTILVGAIRDDQNGQDAGAVYVLVESGGVWTQEAKLVASDGGSFAAFGNDVELEGDRAVVAAPEDDIDGSGQINDERGAVYVYERAAGVWSETAKLLGADSVALDRFGGAIALSGDLLAIGAPGQDTATTSAGAVYVFAEQGGWSEVIELTASDAAAGDLLGIEVDLAGTTLIAGAVFDDDGGTSSGSAYLFEDRGAGWGQAAKLTAGDAQAWDRFGCAVGLAGATAIVGAVAGDTPGVPDAGTLYSFALGHASVAYGTGHPGSGGFVPTLTSPVCPADQQPLALAVANGLGGTVGLLLVGGNPGNAPLFGGTLLAFPPFFAEDTHALLGTPGVAGAGTTLFTFPPQTTVTAGTVVFCQVGYLDPGAVGNVSFSAGLAVELP